MTGKQKSVLILGGSYLQHDFVNDAINLGYKVTCIDGNKACDVANALPNVFQCVNFGDILEFKSFLDKNSFDAVISPANEIGNLRVAQLAEEYNIPYNSYDTVLNTMDKAKLKHILQHTNIKYPKKIKHTSNDNLDFPFMVKPSNSSASRGVSLVKNYEEFESAILEAEKYIGDNGTIVLEEYIEGEQYSIETITFSGKHYIAGVVREITSGAPDIVERSNHTNKTVFGLKSKFTKLINVLLDEVNVQVGACHIELLVRDDDIYIIDFATRSGGWRSRLLKYANASFYNKLILDSYLNQPIDLNDLKSPSKAVTVAYMLYKEDMNQYYQAQENNELMESYFYNKEPVSSPSTLIDAYGYFFASYDEDDLKYRLDT